MKQLEEFIRVLTLFDFTVLKKDQGRDFVELAGTLSNRDGVRLDWLSAFQRIDTFAYESKSPWEVIQYQRYYNQNKIGPRKAVWMVKVVAKQPGILPLVLKELTQLFAQLPRTPKVVDEVALVGVRNYSGRPEKGKGGYAGPSGSLLLAPHLNRKD